MLKSINLIVSQFQRGGEQSWARRAPRSRRACAPPRRLLPRLNYLRTDELTYLLRA